MKRRLPAGRTAFISQSATHADAVLSRGNADGRLYNTLYGNCVREPLPLLNKGDKNILKYAVWI